MIAPWNVMLPTELMVGGEEYPIRSDFRVALDTFLALTDPELDNYNKAMELIDILYVDEIPVDCYSEAIQQGLWFLNGGEPERSIKQPKVVDWVQDYSLISAPISQMVGRDIRGIPYDKEANTGGWHWWSFLQCYSSIGDCTFAHVVRIRDKQARGKKLDDTDREFYRRNRDIIDIKKSYTQAEEEFLKKWM